MLRGKKTISQFKSSLRTKASPKKAEVLARFFKTGAGEYGEGDIFLGVTVPETRVLALRYTDMPMQDIATLITSPIHEERLAALLILVHNFSKGDEAIKQRIAHFYLKQTQYINNWDLVDLSAEKILGAHAARTSKHILYALAKSKNIWERRIAIIATHFLIKKGEYKDTLAISTLLLHDTHDLIHKAVGWMLREVGKRSLTAEEAFLVKHAHHMPRTALRYAIEKFPEPKRRHYLGMRHSKMSKN